MKHLTVILMSLVLMCNAAVATAVEQQMPLDEANTEFAQKNFQRAAADYQAIISKDGFSAPVLFNLANAYYQDGKLGLAILNYERARVLAPTDPDIAFNLRLARTRVGLADRPMTWLDQAARCFSLNTLSWIGSIAIVVLAVGLISRRSILRHRFAWRMGMIASGCVVLATIAAVSMQWSQLQQGIVTVKNTPVYISPVTVTQPLYTLAEGQTVALHGSHGEFTLVQTSDGHRGWIKTADVGRLIPPTQHAQATTNPQA